jgi:hypothetical protein
MDVTALIFDNGLFVELAPRLARDYESVLYYSPWKSAYPKAAGDMIGRGLSGVRRVSNFWDAVDRADLIVFPDIYDSDAQEVLADKLGKPVWGHRSAEALELDRWGTRELQERIGLPGPKSEFLSGVDELEEYLRDPEHKNKWVKISTYRGDGETWHHDSWHTSSIYLDHFRNRVGALAQRYEFLVEEAIDDAIEIGYDGWTVNGEWPDACYWGFEVKDRGYIGQFSDYEDMPKPIKDINDKMAPLLKKAVGFCSFEFRLTRDGTAYMIDPCLRAGSPPFEGTMEGYKNLGEIIWEGANGKMCPPESAGKYIAMAMIHSPFALTNWVPIDVPGDVRKWLKLRNAAVVGKKLYHVPTHGEMPEIGAVIAVDDDLDRAIALVKERAEKVKGYGLEIHTDALDDAQKEIETASEFGVDF